MTKTITLKETLAIASNINPEVPPKIAKMIIENATRDSIQNIGGFPLTDPLLVQDRMYQANEIRLKAIETFNSEKDYLKKKLQKIGIDNYLAIVPTTYWKNICDAHNLETVEPDMKGLISVNTKVPYELIESAKKNWKRLSQGFGVLTLGTAGLSLIAGYNYGFKYWSFLAIISLGLGFLTWVIERIGVMKGKSAIRKYLKTTTYQKLVHELLSLHGIDYRWSTNKVKLILPSPPIEVVLLLRKLRDTKETFRVTADPLALQFDPSVEALYLRGHTIEQRRIELERLDPIITIEHNGATAVLAQFGEFQWEKKVVEDIISSVPLPI